MEPVEPTWRPSVTAETSVALPMIGRDISILPVIFAPKEDVFMLPVLAGTVILVDRGVRAAGAS